MGGDGGVYANSRQFIRGCKTEAEVPDASKSIKEKQQRKANTCAQSAAPLSEPVVCCQMGNLYNKEDILTALLNKSLNSNFSHIKSLKDLKEIKFTKNPAYVEDNTIDSNIAIAKYICPITGLDFNGNFPFICIWSSGHLISEKSIKEMGVEALQSEYGPFAMNDIVYILPLDDSVNLNRSNMEIRQQMMKNLSKLSKKRKMSNEAVTSEAKSNDEGANEKIQKQHSNNSQSTIGHSSGNKDINLKMSSSLVKTALTNIQSQATSSQTFKNLFHKDNDLSKKKSADDLFMRISGSRYTL